MTNIAEQNNKQVSDALELALLGQEASIQVLSHFFDYLDKYEEEDDEEN